MYLGDNFIVGGITALVEEFRSGRPDAQHHADQRCRIRGSSASPSWTSAGEVVGLEEKPQHPKSDLALVGVYIFTPAVHEAVSQLSTVVAAGSSRSPRPSSGSSTQGRKVRSTIITGYWKDTGNVADMLEVNRMVLETIDPAGAGDGRGRASSSAGWWSRLAPG